MTEKMIKYFVQKALGRRTFQKPRISICVPSGVTEVERNAVQQATFAAGARDVYLIEEPVAAAIGAGIDISKACGNLIVDIGGRYDRCGRDLSWRYGSQYLTESCRRRFLMRRLYVI